VSLIHGLIILHSFSLQIGFHQSNQYDCGIHTVAAARAIIRRKIHLEPSKVERLKFWNDLYDGDEEEQTLREKLKAEMTAKILLYLRENYL
jgi:Ulp1 family protease